MNERKSVQNLICKVFNMIIRQCLIRLQNTFQICIHIIENNIHIFTIIRIEKHITNGDNIFMIDQMTKDFYLTIRSHADKEMFENIDDLLNSDICARFAMTSQANNTIRTVS